MIGPDDKILAYNGKDLTTKEDAEKAQEQFSKIGRHSLQIESEGKIRTIKFEVRK